MINEREFNRKLYELDTPLQLVLQHLRGGGYPFDIIQGYRSLEEQLQLYKEGKSTLRCGKHNLQPARAVDICPYLNGHREIKSREELAHMAGWVKGIAFTLNVPVRWGGDWDSDNNTTEREKGDSWDDMYHFELS